MSRLAHQIYVSTMVGIIVLMTAFIGYKGIPYYSTNYVDRFYHPDHDLFKPSGLFGHGLGIIGTLLIIIGVFGYIARKRYAFLSRMGRLKYWLEFHIFLCVLGPIMILFHTAFKFGGIVSISFWSMVAVVASGVIGRFIYIQIPRTIEGKELSLQEVNDMKSNVGDIINKGFNLSHVSLSAILVSMETADGRQHGNLLTKVVGNYMDNRKKVYQVRSVLRKEKVPRTDTKQVLKLIKNEISINNKIDRLQTMQKLFRYWHIAHLPFALIMLIIMVLHVGITLAFGARWIF